MRNFTLLSLAAMMTTLLGVMIFFAQLSAATRNVAPSADLYGGTSAPYLPLHTLKPIF